MKFNNQPGALLPVYHIRNMSKKDKKLISDAILIPYTQWHLIERLIEEAESKEAKARLTDIMKSKYHYEEYKSGLL